MKKTTNTSSGNVIRLIKKVNRLGLWSNIMLTLVSIGPIGWFFLDLADQRYDRLRKLFIISLVVCSISTCFWVLWIKGKIALRD
jgi:hypothetical protein